ncbi:MAG TPA: ATP-binding protein [Chitinophagaceae bacterium]|jgi:hypothetical protein|nr:ATP-binding protein [Chitinophagaceae bacterium]
MESIWKIDRIQSYIDNKVEESIQLDYKAANALQNIPEKKREISKDVSAMANSAGGVIIYGIKEFDDPLKKHFPEKIDPIKRKVISKEWLEQVIGSNIQPKIEGVIITPISISNEDVLYVAEIPQSLTVHQANDKRYYKRYNFESAPMEDYEVKDIMNRSKNPLIELNFDLLQKLINANEGGYEYYLLVRMQNKGNVIANYVNYFVELPERIVYNDDESLMMSEGRSGYKFFFGDNTIRDVLEENSNGTGDFISKYGPSRFEPILPRLISRGKRIKLVKNLHHWDQQIFWILQADNANSKEGSFNLKDLLQNMKFV